MPHHIHSKKVITTAYHISYNTQNLALSNPIFPKRQFQEPNHDPFQHQNPEPQVLSNPIFFPAHTSAQQQAKAWQRGGAKHIKGIASQANNTNLTQKHSLTSESDLDPAQLQP